MTHRKRLHPERIVLFLGLIMLATTWALGLTGFLTGNHRLYTWAGYAFAATLVAASTPLVAFVVGLMIEKIRRKRDHD